MKRLLCLRPAKDGEFTILPPVNNIKFVFCLIQCIIFSRKPSSVENQLVTSVGSELKLLMKNFCFLLKNNSLKKIKFVLHGTNWKFFRIYTQNYFAIVRMQLLVHLFCVQLIMSLFERSIATSLSFLWKKESQLRRKLL